jgi:hypothetical protein
MTCRVTDSGSVEQAAVREHGKWEAATQKCGQCMDGPSFKKHLMVALGKATRLYWLVLTGCLSSARGDEQASTRTSPIGQAAWGWWRATWLSSR